MVWVQVAFQENDGNHENDENDEDNSDSYKQGVECWIRGNHGNRENDENHENPGCEPRVPGFPKPRVFRNTRFWGPKNRCDSFACIAVRDLAPQNITIPSHRKVIHVLFSQDKLCKRIHIRYSSCPGICSVRINGFMARGAAHIWTRICPEWPFEPRPTGAPRGKLLGN